MSAIYWACAEVLIAAAQLGADRDLQSPDRLSSDMLALLQNMVSKCRSSGVADADTAEARYALVAFIDEQILKSNWAGRAEWMNNPLQLQLYREYTAGENFFRRMGALLTHPQGSAALEVYYLCLALGFTGAAIAGRNPESYAATARERFGAFDPAAPISPHALPNDHYALTAPRRSMVLGIALSCACVVVLGLGLLAWSTSTTLHKTERDLTAETVRVKAASTAR